VKFITGRFDECKEIISKISAKNEATLSDELIANVITAADDEFDAAKKKSNYRVRDLFK